MDEDLGEEPNDFCCPITNALFVDPVVAEDGQSYERTAINNWFQRKRTSPVTGAPLRSDALYDNHRLKAIINNYKEKGPEIKKAQQIIQNLQETINAREAAFNDRLRQEEAKSLEVLQKYNNEKAKWAAIENELAGLRRNNLLLQERLLEVNNNSKAKDEEIKASRLLQERLMQANATIKNKEEEIQFSNGKLMEANAAIKAKDEEIKVSRRLQERLMQANFAIKAKDEEIKLSNGRLMEANNSIKVKDEEIKASAILIKNKDTEIRFSQGQLVERNTAIRAKDEEIKKLKEELAYVKRALEEYKARDENQKNEENSKHNFNFPMPDSQRKLPAVDNKEKGKRPNSSRQTSQDFRILSPATTWICEKCTLENQNSWNLCAACENLKPGISVWVCKKCKLINNQDKTACDRCRHKRKAERHTADSRETERSTVLDYEKDGYGNAFYAVSPDWITTWQNFTKGEERRPGKIITSLFYDSKGSIKQSLKKTRDYQMINKRQWDYLHSIYGGDAPLICSSYNIYDLKDPSRHFERPISSRIGGNGVISYSSM